MSTKPLQVLRSFIMLAVVASGSTIGGARVWAREPVSIASEYSVRHVAPVESGAKLVGLGSETMAVWDARSGKRLHMMEAESGVCFFRLSCSADGSVIAAGTRGGRNRTGLLLFDSRSGKRLPGFELPQGSHLGDVAVSDDGQLLVWCEIFHDSKKPGVAHLFDLRKGRHVKSIAIHCSLQGRGGEARVALFRDKSKLLVPMDYGKVFAVCDLNTGRMQQYGGRLSIRSLAASPDGRRAAVTDSNSDSVLIWNLQSGEVETKMTQRELGFHPDHAAYSRDGDHLLVSDSPALMYGERPGVIDVESLYIGEAKRTAVIEVESGYTVEVKWSGAVSIPGHRIVRPGQSGSLVIEDVNHWRDIASREAGFRSRMLWEPKFTKSTEKTAEDTVTRYDYRVTRAESKESVKVIAITAFATASGKPVETRSYEERGKRKLESWIKSVERKYPNKLYPLIKSTEHVEVGGLPGCRFRVGGSYANNYVSAVVFYVQFLYDDENGRWYEMQVQDWHFDKKTHEFGSRDAEYFFDSFRRVSDETNSRPAVRESAN